MKRFKIREKLLGFIRSLLAVYVLSVVTSGFVHADTTTPKYTGTTACSTSQICLNSIVQNTYGMLQSINDIPTYLDKLTELAISWLDKDKTQFTADIQSNFAAFGDLLVKDSDKQNSLDMQQKLTADLFSLDDTQKAQLLADLNKSNPKILSSIKNINELSYGTVLGVKPLAKVTAGSDPYNYIVNASGISLLHLPIDASWVPKKGKIGEYYTNRYARYFNTVKSVESFNGYVLSNLYADYLNGYKFTTLQTTLIGQASKSDWFSKVAGEENLGVLMRQLLLFQSQTYVLLAQMVQTQKQMLSAQVMTNAILIANNSFTETQLVKDAGGLG